MTNLSKASALRACVLVSLATACAAAPARDTSPRRYHCEGTVLTKAGRSVVVDGANASLLREDEGGDRYATSTTKMTEYAEYVIPREGLLDATVTRYAVTDSPDPNTWPLLGSGVCVVEGGNTDLLRRYAAGASVSDIAKQLGLEPEEARTRIGAALARLRCRYHGGC